MAGTTSMELLSRWREHRDEDAAKALYDRYVARLIRLARSKLKPTLAVRVDAEDVVQSAYRTFFVRVRDGRLLVQPGGELWGLLAAITLHKVHGQVEYEYAEKRTPKREVNQADAGSSCLLSVEALARDPWPGEEAALAEELEQVMSEWPQYRQIVELRLVEQLTTVEIAKKVGLGDRRVRMVLREIGKKMENRLAELARP